MKNKMDAVVRVTQHLLNELTQVKDLAIGTLQTIKHMPDYEKAIEALKQDVVEKPSETEEVKSLETLSD
jgi:cell shape-determining protein MreC